MDLIEKNEKYDELKNKLKEKYQTLTDADLNFTEGKEKDMLRMVGYKLRKTKQQMQQIIAEL